MTGVSGAAQAADNLAAEEGEEGSDGLRLAGLKRQLEECRSELFEVYHQISELEAIADQVSLESKYNLLIRQQ